MEKEEKEKKGYPEAVFNLGGFSSDPEEKSRELEQMKQDLLKELKELRESKENEKKKLKD